MKRMIHRHIVIIESRVSLTHPLAILVFLSLSIPVYGQPGSDNMVEDANVHDWIEQHFGKSKVPPFSFMYGGKKSDSFIQEWEYTVEKIKSADPALVEAVHTYRDEQTGLVVKCTVTSFKDFPAVEWVLKFTNTSEKNTPLIERAAVIDHSFVSDEKGSFILHHARGCNAERSDFQPVDEQMQVGQNIYMSPTGGRSSDQTAFPFFNIEKPGQQGIMVAVGWTGKWYADVRQSDDKTVRLKSGMERMKLSLYPEEEIRTPRICLLFWSGEDRMTGHNQFRQFILAHHTRKIDGNRVELPFSNFLAREGPPPCNEHTCTTESMAIAMIKRHKQFDIVPDAFWLDAGWYPCEDGLWWKGTGNWIPNPENFPNGLKPVSDAAHDVGAKLLVWFEIERIYPGTRFDELNPDWLLKLSGDYYWGESLFNLGNVDARLWLTDYVSDFLKKEGIDIYRQDYNRFPMLYWEENDKPGRIGISEIRHIEGLYAYWDSLLARNPDLIIDNCASGGRRIDLETVSRSSPFWRTDYNYGEPNGSQCHTYGLNFYLPLHGTGNFTLSPYHFRSNLSTTMGINWNINGNQHSQSELQKYLQDFKRFRPYYYGDYYPLTTTENMTRDDVWLAYQLNRPDQGDGIILAFRREDCNKESIIVKLRGLETNTLYMLIDDDAQTETMVSGEELMQGYLLTLDYKPGSLLILYSKLP